MEGGLAQAPTALLPPLLSPGVDEIPSQQKGTQRPLFNWMTNRLIYLSKAHYAQGSERA